MVWIAGVCAVCLCVCMPLYLHYKAAHLPLACCYKSLGTLCAFLLALIAGIRLDPKCYICAGGIFLYAVADYLLEFRFELGAGFFLGGHICLIAFFLNLAPVSSLHLIALVLLIFLMGFVYYRWRSPMRKQLPFFIVYGLALVMMSACSLGCFPTHGTAGIFIACGGALFLVSDLFLLRRLVFPADFSFNWLIMTTYYVSILLFGIACLQC